MSAIVDPTVQAGMCLVDDINLFSASVAEIQAYWLRDLSVHTAVTQGRPFFPQVHLIERVFSPLNRAKAQEALASLIACGLLLEGQNGAVTLTQTPQLRIFALEMAGYQPMRASVTGELEPYTYARA